VAGGGWTESMTVGLAMAGYTLASASGVDWRRAAPVPEPAASLLLALGGAALLLRCRRRCAEL